MGQIPQEIKDKRLPHIQKLVEQLKPKDILFEGEDSLGNVVFKYKDREKRIRGEEFYRLSGIASYKVDIGEHEFELRIMGDAMFYTSFLKTVLLYVFYPPKPKK